MSEAEQRPPIQGNTLTPQSLNPNSTDIIFNLNYDASTFSRPELNSIMDLIGSFCTINENIIRFHIPNASGQFSGNDSSISFQNRINIFISQPIQRKGYDFLGWYTDPTNGSEVETIDSSTPSTFYAHWLAQAFKIHYKPEKSFFPFENDPQNPLSYTIDTPTITLKSPKQATLVFVGWQDNNDPTRKPITNYSIPRGSIGDKFLIATFSDKVKVTIEDISVNGDNEKAALLATHVLYFFPGESVSGSILGQDKSPFKYHMHHRYRDCTTIIVQKDSENKCYRRFLFEGGSAQLRSNLNYSEPIFDSATATFYYSNGKVIPGYENINAMPTPTSNGVVWLSDGYQPVGTYAIFDHIKLKQEFLDDNKFEKINMTRNEDGTYKSGKCYVAGEPGSLQVLKTKGNVGAYVKINGLNISSLCAVSVLQTRVWVPVKIEDTLENGQIAKCQKYPQGTAIKRRAWILEDNRHVENGNWVFKNGELYIEETYHPEDYYNYCGTIVIDHSFVIEFDFCLESGYEHCPLLFRPKEFPVGEISTIPNETPVSLISSPFKFVGWSTSKNGEAQYFPGQSYLITKNDGSLPQRGDKVILYAIWLKLSI